MRGSSRLCDPAQAGNHPAMEADMNRMVLKPALKSVLAFGAALVLLGGCASYDGYDRGYRGGGYYDQDYYAGSYGANRDYVPYGGYGGGGSYHADRDHRDGDRARNRDSDRGRDHDQNRNQDRGDRRDQNRGDRSDNNAQHSRDVSRDQPASPPPQQSSSGGSRDGGGRHDSGSQSRGGPEGRFGHPGTTANPL
jgi:hypothetical protein